MAGLACELWRPRCENSSRLGPHITQQARRLVIRPRCNGRHFLFLSAGALPHSLSRKYIGGCRPSSEARRARSPCVGLLLYENSGATRTRRRHGGSNVFAVAGAPLNCEDLFLYGPYQLRLSSSHRCNIKFGFSKAMSHTLLVISHPQLAHPNWLPIVGMSKPIRAILQVGVESDVSIESEASSISRHS